MRWTCHLKGPSALQQLSCRSALARCAAGAPCNGWEHWFFEEDGAMVPLDALRERFRSQLAFPA